AVRLDGFILVPEDGLYAFELLSDDGSRLAISGRVVVDNDGLHAAESRSGVAALERGMHPIAIEWFNRTGGKALALRWSLAGAELRPVAPASLFRVADGPH
ncbi:MAG: hypothetical protein KDA22_06395, partial [Phycisphaerales bacterium]|nr:hypothetical protein [Phycisphaerales bacterium]